MQSNNPGEGRGQNRFARECYEWIDSIFVAIAVITLLFTFLFRVVSVIGPSMENTLHSGDRVIISNLFYTPKNGDIIVASRIYANSPAAANESNQPVIKRVIATSGQTVDVDYETSTVTVDGKVLKEDYIKDLHLVPVGQMTFPQTVPQGCVFVMGDNRNNSMDSRYTDKAVGGLGMVDERYILGHAVFRILPLSGFGSLLFPGYPS